MKEVIFNNKIIGFVDGDIYRTKRKSKIHYFIKGKGYPIASKVLEWLKIDGVKKIRIIQEGAKGITTYETSLINYLNAPEFQEGEFEPQKCYPVACMEKK